MKKRKVIMRNYNNFFLVANKLLRYNEYEKEEIV